MKLLAPTCIWETCFCNVCYVFYCTLIWDLLIFPCHHILELFTYNNLPKVCFFSLAHFVKSCNNFCNVYSIEIILVWLESWDIEDKFQHNLFEENKKEKWKKWRRKLAISRNIFLHVLNKTTIRLPYLCCAQKYICLWVLQSNFSTYSSIFFGRWRFSQIMCFGQTPGVTSNSR